MKMCKHCGVEKKLNEFRHRNANEKHRFYYEAICKECDRARVTNFQRTAKGVVSKIYARQRNSSAQRGHPMPSYSLEELREWVHAQEIFWQLHEQWVANDFAKKLTPSLDRIDNKKPYELSNLQIMTWKENNHRYAIDVKNHVNCSIKNLRPVIQLDLHGRFLNEYPSIAIAARATGASTSGIMIVSKNICNTANGFRWAYKDEYNPSDSKWQQSVKKPLTKRAVIQLDQQGDVVGRYDSLTDANKATGVNRKGIAKWLNKPRLFGGFYWQEPRFFAKNNKAPTNEAAQEFDITEDKAKYWFARSEGQLLTPKSNLLLGFGGDK